MTEANGAPRHPWLRRSLLGAAAAVCVLFGISALELKALAGSEPIPGGAWSGYLSLTGLLSPLACAVGIAAGILSAWIQPAQIRLPAWLDQASPAGRRQVVALCITLPPALLIGSLAVTRAGLAVWDAVGSSLSAGLLAGLLAAVLSLILYGAARYCAFRVADRLSAKVSPRAAAVAALSVTAVIGAALVGFGETSGGGGTFRIFGVLRRAELSLAPVVLLLVLASAAYLAPLALSRLPNGVCLAPPLLSLLCLPVASSALEAPGLSIEIERKTALAGLSLKRLQGLTDRDGDGFAGLFGGGDCNDSDPNINPSVEDVPGNGSDEDCSGSDSQLAAPVDEAKDAASAAPDVAAAPPSLKIPDQLNVLFVTIDTLRYDLGYMGYERPISPNIDALAKRSVVFENAYALASYTSKSLGPLLIGRYGSETNRGWLHFNRYPAADVMLQERIQSAGLTTVSVQGHWYFDVQYGIGRGFDVLNKSAAPRRRQKEGDKTVNSKELTDAALSELTGLSSGEKPFFMWVHYLDPHADYVAHEEFHFGKNQRAKYDGEVAFTDHHVGRLLDWLAESPLGKNTAVLLTSDHGEAFGEHGMVRHGFELWEELVRVPLLIHVPTIPPRQERARRGAIDLAPTILELLGLPLPSGPDDFLSGVSMLPDLLLGPDDEAESRPVLVDMQAGPYNSERQAFIENDYKLVTSNSRPLGLYDLKSDPGEKKNLLRNKELVQGKLDRFKQFRSKLKRIYVKPKPR